ncbi:Predicted cobalt transporter CbtA [hydrothermal vent metagenome]|uniref:Predicted cobalt transporter CbtA n=1 Tax=hydrothermal vent metagenome TaxID=652676 RepID=A0A3B0ZDZ3_9ZZZZ
MNISFKDLFTIAALTSLIAGVVLTLFQQIQVIPAVLEAEGYEPVEHSQIAHVHEDDEQTEWAPAEGLERNLFTAAANIVVALGFALLLGAAAAWRGSTLNWRSGLLWGVAGYVVFFVAPSLGLHPELPGTEAANLQLRQIWWVATVLCTATGLALIFFKQRYIFKALGIALIFTPHIIGAPLPDIHSALAPDELIHAFIIATILSNAVFWLSLGGLYGFFNQKLAR